VRTETQVPRTAAGRRVGRTLAVAITAAAAAWPLTQAAVAKKPVAPDVPAKIAVPAGNKLFLIGHAVGVQIYSCNATPAGVAWGFVAPRANLYNDHGKLIVTHFAGPTWQAKDGSAVVGQRVDGVTVDATSIPWLLLSAASTSVGQDGDRLTKTTFIQRIATTGGLAPAAGACNAATVGTQREIPYTADYTFWKAKGR
jgi:hypothetical protein